MGRNGRGAHLSVRTAGEGAPSSVHEAGGQGVREVVGGKQQRTQRLCREGASCSGSCDLFSSLPVSQGVTAVVSVPSKEPQGKCCWMQFATTSTLWKVTILASSFLTTKRSR